jgi:hypothetical protein
MRGARGKSLSPRVDLPSRIRGKWGQTPAGIGLKNIRLLINASKEIRDSRATRACRYFNKEGPFTTDIGVGGWFGGEAFHIRLTYVYIGLSLGLVYFSQPIPPGESAEVSTLKSQLCTPWRIRVFLLSFWLGLAPTPGPAISSRARTLKGKIYVRQIPFVALTGSTY